MPDRTDSPGVGRYAVVVVAGKCSGAEVTQEGVPWRGTLTEARKLASEMGVQAERFGHDDARYMAWCEDGPPATCGCGHLSSQHDGGGCWRHSCVCGLTPEDVERPSPSGESDAP